MSLMKPIPLPPMCATGAKRSAVLGKISYPLKPCSPQRHRDTKKNGILAEDLPYIKLWYLDNVLVHTNRVHGIELGPVGNYDFLRTAELVQ